MKVRIHKSVGNCISLDEFAEIVAPMVGQPKENVLYAVSFMEMELGSVEAMELYCDTCGLTTY